MQRKEQLWVSALGNEKLGWRHWEPPPRTRAGVQEGKGDNEDNRVTPKYPGSAHSRHQTQIPDQISDAEMLFVLQSEMDGEGTHGRDSRAECQREQHQRARVQHLEEFN